MDFNLVAINMVYILALLAVDIKALDGLNNSRVISSLLLLNCFLDTPIRFPCLDELKPGFGLNPVDQAFFTRLKSTFQFGDFGQGVYVADWA